MYLGIFLAKKNAFWGVQKLIWGLFWACYGIFGCTMAGTSLETMKNPDFDMTSGCIHAARLPVLHFNSLDRC